MQLDREIVHFLASEERAEGDVGLLGERIEMVAGAPEMARPPAQFPTVRLGENE